MKNNHSDLNSQNPMVDMIPMCILQEFMINKPVIKNKKRNMRGVDIITVIVIKSRDLGFLTDFEGLIWSTEILSCLAD